MTIQTATARESHRQAWRIPPRRPSRVIAALAALIVAVTVGSAVLTRPPVAHALDNGVARTPPLGWNTWDCHGRANQQWTLSGRTLRALGKCLDAPLNATAGTAAQIWDCSGGSNQQWNLNTNGTISNAANGLCVDIDRNGTANDTAVILWTCHAGANQRWARR
jgi:hypothetical protein